MMISFEEAVAIVWALCKNQHEAIDFAIRRFKKELNESDNDAVLQVCSHNITKLENFMIDNSLNKPLNNN